MTHPINMVIKGLKVGIPVYLNGLRFHAGGL